MQKYSSLSHRIQVLSTRERVKMPNTNDKSGTTPYPTEEEINTLDKLVWELAKQGKLGQEDAPRFSDRFGEKAFIETLIACCCTLYDRHASIVALIDEHRKD
jgi:hypothetical protein